MSASRDDVASAVAIWQPFELSEPKPAQDQHLYGLLATGLAAHPRAGRFRLTIFAL
jgi:hypothetical protein